MVGMETAPRGAASDELDGFVLVGVEELDAPVQPAVAVGVAGALPTVGGVWDRTRIAVQRAKAMHFDGCHKIFISMDDEQVRRAMNIGYESYAPDYLQLREWFAQSCPMRFVSAVSTSMHDANAFYTVLVPQAFED